MRILFLTRYGRLGASSRVRALQFLPTLERLGWNCDVSSLLSDGYVRALYSGKGRAGSVLLSYPKRLGALFGARRYDLLWIEKELFPFFPALAERALDSLGKRYVVDYDDALFHRYDHHQSWLVRTVLGRKIDAVMRHSKVVVAGNRYLAERAIGAGAERVEIVPTVVDSHRYTVADRGQGPITVGWVGSPATAHYLRPLAATLSELQRKWGVRVRLIGSGPLKLESVETELLPWDEASEPDLIGSIDIGVMPLPDTPWERGKCAYKLIQYMACGLPVIASPVGVNSEIVRSGINGFLASTDEEWKAAFEFLIRNREARVEFGRMGRALVEEQYSLSAQAPRVARIFADAVAK